MKKLLLTAFISLPLLADNPPPSVVVLTEAQQKMIALALLKKDEAELKLTQDQREYEAAATAASQEVAKACGAGQAVRLDDKTGVFSCAPAQQKAQPK